MKSKEIHADVHNTLRNSALSYSTVFKWTSEFIFGREHLDATAPEFIEKVHKMIIKVRRPKV